MTRLLIADDEPAPREQLADALALAWPEARIVASAEHGADAWDQWLAHEPDVCFLDIRMPGLSGIDVARRIAGRCPVVFVTAHGDHALQAFDAGAVDYLVKPLDVDRLAQTVARLKQTLQRPAPDAGAVQQLLAQLAGQQRRPAWPDTLQAGVGKEVRLIRVEDVIYCESDSRYTRVVYSDAGKQCEALLRTALKDLLAQLDPARFQQVHRSVVVASAQIASALRDDEGGMLLRLRGSPDTLTVSRPFQGLFKGQ
ncbi:LytR/AlgR family response regulator transcription factor [Roseateles sp. LYH14W]|uniref:LytR/AlgR family response regulator transcription factor n=1 Tax=Pelomonas parva TaxID=3299032 RepID=A0ABW7FAS6_9BURK